MYTFHEGVQDNITLDQQRKGGEIVGKKWTKFDSDYGKHDHYNTFVLENSPNGTLSTCPVCFEW